MGRGFIPEQQLAVVIGEIQRFLLLVAPGKAANRQVITGRIGSGAKQRIELDALGIDSREQAGLGRLDICLLYTSDAADE